MVFGDENHDGVIFPQTNQLKGVVSKGMYLVLPSNLLVTSTCSKTEKD